MCHVTTPNGALMCHDHWNRWYCSAAAVRYHQTLRDTHLNDFIWLMNAEDGNWPGGVVLQ